ncbi:hypothetical protein [Dyella mobilis]|uniref:Uncharacterized protein n=1 Tax=Dyella mobilis TaxID=1849582 RepID=A0ABS2KB04_9GAMM|nr:hypothetical protein [Dyella mobilis]MBM7127977.1 hypothetical protein [Dyella mobilis]GLR00130.1 hypothetical protein GCM10007863_45500 [Dyella mobilis]
MWKFVELACNIISVIFAFLAAYWWYLSATDEPPPGHVERGSPDMLIDMKVSLVGMMKLQSKWNKRAAGSAAIAAAFQGFALLIQSATSS